MISMDLFSGGVELVSAVMIVCFFALLCLMFETIRSTIPVLMATLGCDFYFRLSSWAAYDCYRFSSSWRSITIFRLPLAFMKIWSFNYLTSMGFFLGFPVLTS